MSDYSDELAGHTAPSTEVPAVEIDPATLDALHAATSADGRVTAYVSGRLQFDHVEIDHTGDLDQLGGSVVEAVNAAMTAAQAPVGTGPGGLEADQDALVAQFEAKLEAMDAQMDALMAKLDAIDKTW